MTRAKQTKKRAPRSKAALAAQGNVELAARCCQDCPEWQTMRQRLRVSELLVKAIKSFETRLNEQDFKPTVTEYLKLLQMQQDLDATESKPKEIKVTWVEPARTSESEK